MAEVTIWSQADIDALKEAVRGGVLTVSYDGPPSRSVTYQSLQQMRALLAEMVAGVGNAAGTRTKYRYGTTRKGI